jgi:DNA-binding NarL/FixJ family response regulator
MAADERPATGHEHTRRHPPGCHQRQIPTALAIRGALTARELEIFTRLASGESNRDIGRALSLSANTVSNHIASILAKLHLHNRIQAAVQAVRSGLA